MMPIKNDFKTNLLDLSCNMRTTCDSWKMLPDLMGLEANMMRIISRLVTEICHDLDNCNQKALLSSHQIQQQLMRIGELTAFTNLCLNYVFVSIEHNDLHHQLTFLSRNANQAADFLEQIML